ncbi:MAG: SIR2 family protein [Bauldia sp.]
MRDLQLQLPQLATILERTQRSDFRSFLVGRFTVASFPEAYQIIDKINTTAIFTTNIDDLVLKIFQGNASRYLNDISVHGPVFGDSRGLDYVALHGCVRHPEDNLVFGASELASTFSADPDRWRYLVHRLRASPTLFWGYALNDAGTLQALDHAASISPTRERHEQWVILRDPTPEAVSYFKAMGLSIIESDTTAFLKYLEETLAAPAPSVTSVDPGLGKLFPEGTIPDLATITLRPVIEFYEGADPSWSDIYTGNLYRSSHYRRLMDLIHSGRNAAVIGIPASGKTTLIMQAAAGLATATIKLMFFYITREKAHLIVKSLRGERCTVFLDNWSDSVEAYNILAAQANIQVIAAERDYSHEIISHLVSRVAPEIIDVTELSDADSQSLYDRIPAAIRRPSLVKVAVGGDRNPSFFEFVESNITSSSLHERFRHVMDELDGKEPELLEVLVMMSYVHACRTPVSFDMLLGFVERRGRDLDEIRQIPVRIGSMVADYHGPLIDTVQDHFVPRSLHVSETIRDTAPAAVFRKVVTRFHSEVSPIRIAGYDVFRRNAFDADVLVRAFPKWEDGREFYDRAYEKDGSPFVLQQGALFLSRKVRFREAFEYIDRALTLTGRRIPSIRHSHAVILFRANIDSGEDVKAKTVLEQSMKIIEECYDYDKRKTYHARTYADQALKFMERFGDAAAEKYLLKAKKWLAEEQRKTPWHRGIRHLARTVGLALS